MNPRDRLYASALALALATALLPFYVELAVGIVDPPGGPSVALQLAVVALGIVGALVARFEAHGMARALVATAAAQGLMGVVSLMVEAPHPTSPAYEVLGVHALFVTLFLASAWLFRRSARRAPATGAAPAR